MTYSVGPARSGPTQWRVGSLRRAGKKFRWSLLPDRGADANDPFAFVLGLLVLLEFVFVMPTVGLVRFAVYCARSPGWYLESRCVMADGSPYGAPVVLAIGAKGRARRLRRALRREFGTGADFNSPAVRVAIAQANASFRPMEPPPASGQAY